MNPTFILRVFGRSTLGRRFTVITLLFLSVLLGIMVYTATTIQKEKSNALLIDLAGRQRMLFQKHINEVFLSSQGITADYTFTRGILHSTLDSLMKGGSVVIVPETGQRQRIPAVPSEEILIKLREQRNHFEKIIELADRFLIRSPDDPEFQARLLTLRAKNSTLIGIADEAVKLLNRHSESNITMMMRWESITAFFVALLGMFVTGQGIRASKKLENEIAERKRAESALQDSDLFLNSIIENIPHMIFVKDAKNLQFLRWNKAGEELVGFPKEALIGKTDYDFFPKSEADFFTTKDREVLAGKTLIDIPEEVIQTKSQGTRYLHTKKIPILDDHGTPQYLLGISEDITKQKQAEDVIRKGERRFRAIYEQAPTGIAILDSLTGRFTQINPKYCDITGYSQVEMLDRTFQDITYPDDLQADLDQMHQLLAGQISSFQIEKRYIRKDGEVIWVNLTCVPLWLEPTDPRQHMAMVEDVTERKKAEKKFRESEKKFRVMAETVPNILYTNRPDGSCDFVSQRLYEYTGLPSDSGLEFGWTMALHSDDLERSKEKWLRTAHAGLPYEDRYRLISPNGTYRWFLARAIPIKNARGQTEKYFGVSTDIHDLVQAEEALGATEQMYRQILDSISDMVFVKDQNFRILWANKAFRSYYNMTNEELRGILDAPFNEPEFTKHYNEADAYVLNTGKILDIPDEPVTQHDGQVHVFHTIKAPLFGENGEVMKLVGVSRDISERLKSEKALEVLAKSTVALGSQNFFENLVHQLASNLQVPMVFLAERVKETFPIVHGVVFWRRDHFEPKFEYDCLEGPCEKVFDGQPVYIPQRVQELFPKNPTVKALNLESYSGTPLFNSEGAIIGNLAIMDQKPLCLTEQDQALLQIFADRAGAELERKRAQGALQESEERYRTLYEDNPSMYFTVAQDGKILSVNQFGAQQLGHSVEELVGQPVIDLFVEDDQPQVQQRFKDCLSRPLAVFSWEFRKVRKDKSIVWVKEVARSVYNKDGEIVVLIVCEDISERKKTEKELQEWKALTESVLGQLPKGFAYRCLNNKHWTAVYVSDGIEEVTGFPASALLSGKINYDSLLASGENERVWSNVQDALVKHLPYENEHQVVTREGKKKWILARGRFIYDDAGQLLYLDGLNVDITEQKFIENELRTSEARFRSLVEHVPFCIHEIELNGKISSMNKSGQQMIGIENESQVIGDSYLKLTEEKDHERIRNFFEQALQGQPVDFEFNETTLGKLRFFTKSFVPIRGRDGTVLKIVGISEEITERKESEKRLLDSEAKRTEALRQSDELKSALLSSVSHELRTPLTAMKGSVSSIIGNGQGSKGQEQEEVLKGIDREINYMSHLVDNLLDMSQIEAGTLIPQKEWHLLEDLVEGALRRTAQTSDTRNIEIHIPENVPPIFVDALEIQQVLINLLDNAVKYSSPSSPIRIHVRVEAQQITVEASNMGEPIQPQNLERIFDRFYRQPPLRQQPIRGTGLGLAICKGIVEAHGGRIWADSIEREVTIAFTIPLIESMPSFSLEGRHKA